MDEWMQRPGEGELREVGIHLDPVRVMKEFMERWEKWKTGFKGDKLGRCMAPSDEFIILFKIYLNIKRNLLV